MPQTVYAKTALGTSALAGDRAAMSALARQLFILIDGHRTRAELAALTGADTLNRGLHELLAKGYIASEAGMASLNTSGAAEAALAAKSGAPPQPGPAAGSSRRFLALVVLVMCAGGAAFAAYTKYSPLQESAGTPVTPTSPVAPEAGVTGTQTQPAGAASASTVAPAPVAPAPSAAIPAPPVSLSANLHAGGTPPVPTQVKVAVPAPRNSLVSPEARPVVRAGGPAGVVEAAPAKRESAVAVATLAPPAPVPEPRPVAPAQAPAVAPLQANVSAAVPHQERTAPQPAAAPDAHAPVPVPLAPAAAAGSGPPSVAAPLLASLAKAPPAARPAAPAPAPVALHIRRQYPPDTPERAVRAGIRNGRLVALLDVGADGKVSGVSLVQASAPELYDEEVAFTLRRWTFDPPGRNAQVKVVVNFAE